MMLLLVPTIDLNMDKFFNILNNIERNFYKKVTKLKDFNEDCMKLKILVYNTPYKTSHCIFLMLINLLNK